MADFQGQIESERGKLKELLSKVPGFKGYIEMEDRRTADKMIRELVADRYQELLDDYTGIQTEFVDRGDLDFLDDLETVTVKIRTFIDRIRNAAYGYSSFFSAIKIDQEKLERIYDYDHALLDGVDSLKESMEKLASAVEPDQIKGMIAELKKAMQDIITKFDRRKEEILGGEVPEDDLPSAE
jgi:hypothetical protein